MSPVSTVYHTEVTVSIVLKSAVRIITSIHTELFKSGIQIKPYSRVQYSWGSKMEHGKPNAILLPKLYTLGF